MLASRSRERLTAARADIVQSTGCPDVTSVQTLPPETFGDVVVQHRVEGSHNLRNMNTSMGMDE